MSLIGKLKTDFEELDKRFNKEEQRCWFTCN